MKHFRDDNLELTDFSCDPAITMEAHSLTFSELSEFAPVREFQKEDGYKYLGIELVPSIYYTDNGEILVLDEALEEEYIDNFERPLDTVLPFCYLFDRDFDEEPHTINLDYEGEVTYFDVDGNEVVLNKGLSPIDYSTQDWFLPDLDDEMFNKKIDKKIDEESHESHLDCDEEVTFFDEYGNEIVFDENLSSIDFATQDCFSSEITDDMFEDDIYEKLIEYLDD